MRRPHSLKSGVWVIVAIGVFLFAPTFLVARGFERWVDVPACRALCESRALQFRSFRTAGKQGQYCRCAGEAAEQTFRQRFTVSGGDSTLEHVLDWVVRPSAVLSISAIWMSAANLGASQWKKWRARAARAR